MKNKKEEKKDYSKLYIVIILYSTIMFILIIAVQNYEIKHLENLNSFGTGKYSELENQYNNLEVKYIEALEKEIPLIKTSGYNTTEYLNNLVIKNNCSGTLFQEWDKSKWTCYNHIYTEQGRLTKKVTLK